MDMRDQRSIGKKLKRPCQPPRHDPTPEDIKAACKAIQEEWSEGERMRRSAPERAVDMTVVHRVVDDGDGY